MNVGQKISMLCLVSLVSACSVVPADRVLADWGPPLKRSGNSAFEHLACSADGFGQVLLGALEGALDGSTKVLALADQIAAEQASDAEGDEIILVIVGTGAVLGLGVGIGEKVLDLPASYKDCLDRHKALRQKITI